MEKSKILIQAVVPIMDRLNEKIKDLGLRRDVYLNSVLQTQAKALLEGLDGKTNSNISRDYLASQLRALPIAPVSIVLGKDVIAAIDSACSSINVPRDCFVNRVFFFLAAEAKHLEAVGISITTIMGHTKEDLHVNALDNAGAFLGDPFYELRRFMEDYKTTIYEWRFTGKVDGLNCFLEDEDVPGSKEYKNLEALFASL